MTCPLNRCTKAPCREMKSLSKSPVGPDAGAVAGGTVPMARDEAAMEGDRRLHRHHQSQNGLSNCLEFRSLRLRV
jgi:hypothetical protein